MLCHSKRLTEMKNIDGKVIVLGNSAVGKSKIVMGYVLNISTEDIATVGSSVFTRTINIEDKQVTLQIWDTAGQEKFKAMTRQYFRNANAALLVFDITSYASFQSLQGWLQELEDVVQEPMVLALVANKIDLIEKSEVTRSQAIQFSKSISAYYLECSALTKEGVDKIFTKIATGLVKQYEQNGGTLNVYNNKPRHLALPNVGTHTSRQIVGTLPMYDNEAKRLSWTGRYPARVNIDIRNTKQTQSVGGKCC